MIQEAETEDQIGFTEIADFRILDVALFEGNLGKAFACLRDILDAAVESAHLESAFAKSFGKEADSTSGVHRRRKIQGQL